MRPVSAKDRNGSIPVITGRGRVRPVGVASGYQLVEGREPAVFRQVGLVVDKLSVESIVPREHSTTVRPNNLETGKVVPAIKPSAPAEMVRIMCFATRKIYAGRLPNTASVRSNRKALARFCASKEVPKHAVSDFMLHAEHDWLGLTRAQPEAGRIGETRAICIRQDAGSKPTLLSNFSNERSFARVECLSRGVQSGPHPLSQSATCIDRNGPTKLLRRVL